MATTNIRGAQILNATIQRQDLDVSTIGQAVVAKIIQGTGVTLSSTGGDSGTGDVTVSTPPAAFNTFISKSAAYTIVSGDLGKYFICSGGSWTLTLPAAQIGFFFQVRNDQGITGTTGTITLTPPAGTIDGAASLALLPGQQCTVACDGTNWRTFGLQREVILGTQDITSSTSSGTVLLPAGYRMFILEWSDLKSVTDAQNLQALFSTDGGSTFLTTYWWGFGYHNSAQTVWQAQGANSTTYAFIGPTMNNAAVYGQCSLKLHPGIGNTQPNYLADSGDFANSGQYVQRFVVYGFSNVGGPVNALAYRAASGNIANSFLTVKGIV